MRRMLQKAVVLAAFLTCGMSMSAQELVAVSGDSVQTAVPLHIIDSIKTRQPSQFGIIMRPPSQFGIQLKDSTLFADSIIFDRTLPDTLIVDYRYQKAYIKNPDISQFRIAVFGADVFISSKGKRPFVCLARGVSNDGRIVIDNDTTSTLVLDNLNLVSQKGSAISFRQKQKAVIVLPEGSSSRLVDAEAYQTDSTDASNACLYSKGALTFVGKGSLTVTGHYRHGIASGKTIAVDEGRLVIDGVVKNGIHCDKFTMKGGKVDMTLTADASKGVKAKKKLSIMGGHIEGRATGNVTIDSLGTSYCSLLKSDGSMLIGSGEIALTHQGKGGRCISVDKSLTVLGGSLRLECFGDGGSYLTATNDADYYTPKCITVDDTLTIEGGTIDCRSTGLGGKGIVAGKYIAIGDSTDRDNVSLPAISIETKGECIVNNVDEDLRFGCPKGIKSDSLLVIYSGNIAVTTAGMGGEGVECNGKMFIYGGTLECNTFDDGINVADSIEISGGLVYCNSVDNDGIDSNGSICISGGIVASVNQRRPNESFDSEKGQLYLRGGVVFGIGSGDVHVRQSALPYYSTPYIKDGVGPCDRGMPLTAGKYVYVQKSQGAVMALRNDNKERRSFLTVMSPSFTDGDHYTICEGDCPTDAGQTFWGKLFIDCRPDNVSPITEIQVQTK